MLVSSSAKLPSVQRAVVEATRDMVNGARINLTDVIGRIRHWDADVTSLPSTLDIAYQLGRAAGRLESMRSATAVPGVDKDALWAAIEQVDQGASKVADLGRQTNRWEPLYDMIASDAVAAVDALNRFDASLAALQR